MSVDTGADEKIFVDLFLTISSLVNILVATASSRSLLLVKLNFIVLSAAWKYLFLATKVKFSKSRLNSLVNAY